MFFVFFFLPSPPLYYFALSFRFSFLSVQIFNKFETFWRESFEQTDGWIRRRIRESPSWPGLFLGGMVPGPVKLSCITRLLRPSTLDPRWWVVLPSLTTKTVFGPSDKQNIDRGGFRSLRHHTCSKSTTHSMNLRCQILIGGSPLMSAVFAGDSFLSCVWGKFPAHLPTKCSHYVVVPSAWQG